MAMSATLVVDPQVMKTKSDEMKGYRSSLTTTMDDLKSKVSSLATEIWESDSSTAFQKQFTQLHNDLEEVLKIVDEYTADLDEIADRYITTEQKLAEAANALPGDVFNI